MTDKQPEALLIAEDMDDIGEHQAAAELRRLHEVETKYHESIGGFKRDLAEKLEQQRKKNERLTAELRRLHEVNAALLKVLNDLADWESGEVSGYMDAPWVAQKARAAIAKATGEQQ
jgi:hypothetical protein